MGLRSCPVSKGGAWGTAARAQVFSHEAFVAQRFELPGVMEKRAEPAPRIGWRRTHSPILWGALELGQRVRREPALPELGSSLDL